MKRREHFFSMIFGLTGIGNALIGATLPAVLHQWHLSDSQGGVLLLATWGGSTSGALFARTRTGLSAATGLAFSAASLFALVHVSPTLTPVPYVIYGLGLGMTMTSVSLMRAREVDAGAVGPELNRLNLLWALGALCAPAVSFRSLRLLSVSRTFVAVGTVFAVCAGVAFAIALQKQEALSPQTSPGRRRLTLNVRAPLRFCLFAAAAVGLESALGSWLTAYAGRSTRGVLTAVSANSAFWAGLLLSRAFWSVPAVARLFAWRAQAGQLLAVGLALFFLIAIPDRGVLPLCGLLCGWGLGPLYPWILSVSLPRYRSTAVFVLAGLGASLIPWLVGALSSIFGSLRIGLLAPVAAFLLMAALTYQMRSELGEAAS